MYESVKTIQDIRDEHIDVLRDFGVKGYISDCANNRNQDNRNCD